MAGPARSASPETFDAEVSFTPMAHYRAACRLHARERRPDVSLRSTPPLKTPLRLSADLTGPNWLTLRGVFEHAKRTGSGFDEQVLDDIGEQMSLRQFDISDRTSESLLGDRHGHAAAVSCRSTAACRSATTTARARLRRALSDDNDAYSIGVDYVPRDAVSLGAVLHVREVRNAAEVAAGESRRAV